MEIKRSSGQKGKKSIEKGALTARGSLSSIQACLQICLQTQSPRVAVPSSSVWRSTERHAKHPMCTHSINHYRKLLPQCSWVYGHSRFLWIAHLYPHCILGSLWNEIAVSRWAITLSCWHFEKSLLCHPRWKMIFSLITTYYGQGFVEPSQWVIILRRKMYWFSQGLAICNYLPKYLLPVTRLQKNINQRLLTELQT